MKERGCNSVIVDSCIRVKVTIREVKNGVLDVTKV
jgi:hypothetical protein